MAAELAAFRTCLTRLGFNVTTRDALINNGFRTLGDLARITGDAQIDTMVKNLHHWPVPAQVAGAVPLPPLVFPFMSIQMFKALREWYLQQVRLDLNVTAADFTDAVCTATLQRLQVEAEHKAAKKDVDADKPPPLAELNKWHKFWELLSTYLSQLYGAAHIPLTYVMREHTEVTPELQAAAYATEEERLIALTVLRGTHYAMDNVTIWQILKPLVIHGPGWAFVKKCNTTMDGRRAIKILQIQSEGKSAKTARKSKTYASLAKAAYRGPRKGNTYDNYVQIHQDAFNELDELKEPIPPSKQVQDFMKGITDPNLQPAKVVIYGDDDRLNNFEMTQQYLATIVATMKTHEPDGRGVSGVASKDSGKGYLPKDEWKALSSQEKTKILEARKKKAKGTGSTTDATTKGPTKNKAWKRKYNVMERKLAAMEAKHGKAGGSEDGSDSDEGEPEASAGRQFGQHGNKPKASKSNKKSRS